MGRKKVDRSNKIMQTFETTLPLKQRLKEIADLYQVTVSALIRAVLEQYIEERQYVNELQIEERKK